MILKLVMFQQIKFIFEDFNLFKIKFSVQKEISVLL